MNAKALNNTVEVLELLMNALLDGSKLNLLGDDAWGFMVYYWINCDSQRQFKLQFPKLANEIVAIVAHVPNEPDITLSIQNTNLPNLKELFAALYSGWLHLNIKTISMDL